jgi:UDP-N-acetylglucosamine 4-epimerase
MSRYSEISESLLSDPRCWLVTGCAGFIGSALVERLLELGQTVIGLDNFSTGHRENLDEVLGGSSGRGRFSLVEGDITDLETCRRVCDGVDLVLHQAALGSVPASIDDPLATHANNVTGFLNVLLAARDAGIERVVYASSSAIYGDAPGLPKREETIGRALSPYAVSKRVDELYAQVVADCYGLSVVGLRYFNVFGRRQDPDGPYAAVIPKWIERLASGQSVEVFGDGSNSRDFCHVDDCVQANLLAATAPRSCDNAVYNVAYGERTSLLELFEILRDAVGRYSPEVRAARALHRDPRAGDVLHSQAATGALAGRLGFEPVTNIRSGLASTVAWFMSQREKVAAAVG